MEGEGEGDPSVALYWQDPEQYETKTKWFCIVQKKTMVSGYLLKNLT